jgi:hypothetical protein
MITITEQGNPITEDQIATLEHELGAKLSKAYYRFLIMNNGGRPSHDVIDIVGLPGSPTDVQVFFGIDRSIESSNLSWNLAIITERCPKWHVLPIACDSGGNLFCLKVLDGVASEVLYCDMDAPNCVFYEVAPSFDAFLKKIGP